MMDHRVGFFLKSTTDVDIFCFLQSRVFLFEKTPNHKWIKYKNAKSCSPFYEGCYY
jgi:hypothetical protein